VGGRGSEAGRRYCLRLIIITRMAEAAVVESWIHNRSYENCGYETGFCSSRSHHLARLAAAPGWARLRQAATGTICRCPG